MHLSDAEKQLSKRIMTGAAACAVCASLLGLASADGTQREKTRDLDRRVTAQEEKVDNLPADISAIRATLQSMDARLGRIEAAEDKKK